MEPTRRLELEGADNVRDIGGYETVDGRRTRWKTFIRSDRMDRLSVRDQTTLLGYGIRTVVDLRRTEEVEAAPNVFEGSDKVKYLRHNLNGDDLQANAPEPLADLDPVHRIARSYTRNLDIRQVVYRDVLATMASPGALPVIFHCAAGKDRTGRIAALILGNAGVPTATIVEDYGLSGRYWFEAYLATGADLDVASRVHTWQEFQSLACPPEAMVLVLQHLEDRYGGVPAYMKTIGLTDEQIESLRRAAVE